MATTTNTTITVAVAPDRMSAVLRIAGQSDTTQITPEHLAEAVRGARIEWTDQVAGRVNEIHGQLQPLLDAPQEFVVAEGTAPVAGEDGYFELAEELRPVEVADDTPINFYDICHIITVRKDTPLGILYPPRDGTPGRDVFGKTIRPPGTPQPAKAGANVCCRGAPAEVIAEIDGKVVCDATSIEVVPVVDIRGNVNFETGNINAEANVVIHGTVQDLFKVQSTKSISVGETVEGALLDAGEGITVFGGVAGREKAVIRTQGDFVCKYCDSATAFARGNVVIPTQVLNSSIITLGMLKIERGALLGGRAHARCGAYVHTLGSEAEVPTVLSVGIDPELAMSIAEHKREIAAQLRHVRRAREELLALLRDEQRWTPEQRARSHELSAELQQRSAEVTRLEAQRQRLLEQADAPDDPTIHVERKLYGGVIVVISGRAVRFGEEYAGPLRITRETTPGHDEFILTDLRSGESTMLPSSDFTESYADNIGRPSGDRRPVDGAEVAHSEEPTAPA